MYPECSQLEQLAHVNWTCNNDTENMNCTIECADGYDFDHEIKPYYMCGKNTFYLWDFQTDDNPDGKMPACLGTKPLVITFKITNKHIFLKKQFIFFFTDYTFSSD